VAETTAKTTGCHDRMAFETVCDRPTGRPADRPTGDQGVSSGGPATDGCPSVRRGDGTNVGRFGTGRCPGTDWRPPGDDAIV